MADMPPEDEFAQATDDDLGLPIAELLDFEVEPDPGLVSRVVGSIRRRDLTSQFATLWWSGVAEMFLEIVRLIGGLIGTYPATEEGDQT